MIPEAVLNQIQERTDIVELISGYLPLRKAGRSFKAPCPFHPEKTPSFFVNPDKQIFHCFGCGAGGNVFSFVMKQEKKDFLEAVEMLAERAGVEIPAWRASNPAADERAALLMKAAERAADFFHRQLTESTEASKAREYFKKRGIAGTTAARFKLGYAPDSWDALYRGLKADFSESVLERSGLVISKKEGGFYDRFRNRVIFPILDIKGSCLAFGGRVLDDSLPKYLNSPETELYSKGRHLYGFFQAKTSVREQDAVVVVEGYMDLITCHQAGVENVVASLGTALTPDQVRLIKRHTKNVIILYDSDTAGEMATLRGLELFLEEGLEVKIVRLLKGHDPDSFLKAFGAGRLKEELKNAQTLFEYKLGILKARWDARTLEGKVKIANEMVGLFAKVQNEILRAAWTQALSEELGLSEEALLAEIRRSDAKPQSAARPAENAPKTELPAAEKLLLGLMLEEDFFLEKARLSLVADDFQHVKLREIARRILENEGGFVSAAQFINVFSEDAEAARVISMACAEIAAAVDKPKTFDDCLRWVKRSQSAREREGLQVQILAAQQAGDKNRISRLLYDLHQLNKGMKEIYEKEKK
ncbi:MAG: DNA primase [Candidatus Omnitrophica bacterium]|nr:DNA primase [Candidatus Omnitrophota bacterium]